MPYDVEEIGRIKGEQECESDGRHPRNVAHMQEGALLPTAELVRK